MYFFDFLNLEAYKLLESFQSKKNICFVHETLDETDTWNLWIILRDVKCEYLCIHYIWTDWFEEGEDEEKTNDIFQTKDPFKGKTQYKFKSSTPLSKIDKWTFLQLHNEIIQNNTNQQLKNIFVDISKQTLNEKTLNEKY
jgi:hypothetical protein